MWILTHKPSLECSSHQTFCCPCKSKIAHVKQHVQHHANLCWYLCTKNHLCFSFLTDAADYMTLLLKIHWGFKMTAKTNSTMKFWTSTKTLFERVWPWTQHSNLFTVHSRLRWCTIKKKKKKSHKRIKRSEDIMETVIFWLHALWPYRDNSNPQIMMVYHQTQKQIGHKRIIRSENIMETVIFWLHALWL